MRQQQVRRRARRAGGPPAEEDPAPVPGSATTDRTAQVLAAIDAALRER